MVSILTGIILSIGIIYGGFKLVQKTFTRAEDMAPRDMVISEIGQNSAKVSWATANETQGVIEYGTSPTTLNFFAPEATKTTSHMVDLTLLSPQTTYYLQLRIGDQRFDNGGVPWTFTTKSTQTTQPSQESPTPVSSTNRRKSIQTVQIPDDQEPTLSPANCEETDCSKIVEKLGKGCDTQDYEKCLRKKTATSSAAP